MYPGVTVLASLRPKQRLNIRAPLCRILIRISSTTVTTNPQVLGGVTVALASLKSQIVYLMRPYLPFMFQLAFLKGVLVGSLGVASVH